jgi:integrase
VKLTARALETLRAHLERQLEEIWQAGDVYNDNGLVFPNQPGGPMRQWSLYGGLFKRLLQQANLPAKTRFHDLRHTRATLLLSEGVNHKFVQELLAHTTISTTLDIYSHVLPGKGDQTVKAMKNALF